MHSKKLKSLLSILLSVVMTLGVSTTGFAGLTDANYAFSGTEESSAYGDSEAREIVSNLSQAQLDAYEIVKRSNRGSGLIGFTGEYQLDGTNGDISVIVEFVNQPAGVAQISSSIERGRSVSRASAEALAKNDYLVFLEGLDELFGSTETEAPQISGFAATSSAVSNYEITCVYNDAINGVAMTLPSDMVEKLLDIESVYAIYPDHIITLDPMDNMTLAEGYGDGSTPVGLAKERDFLDVNALHERGITGEGIVVGVIDTGVDYNHPDFQGAFKPYQGRNPQDAASLEIDGIFYGRNMLYGMNDFNFDHAPNDPMETTYEDWLRYSNIYAEDDGYNYFYTSHGTHVSGTVAARGTTENSAKGMAPDATLVVYRTLGRYGSGPSSATLKAVDLVYEDGCDVVNMSLGVVTSDPFYIDTIAVNNVILAHDIVFAIAAGNAGDSFYTIGSPGTASLAITVGNGIVDDAEGSIIISADTNNDSLGDNNINLIRNNGTQFIQFENGSYGFETNLLNPNENKAYKLVPIISEVTNSISTGLAEDYSDEIKEQVRGNIAVILRGSPFEDTMAAAKAAGAGALIIINGKGKGPLSEITTGALPTFMTHSYESGMALVEYALANDGYVNFVDFKTSTNQLNNTSSLGPVPNTLMIKPDVVAPGSNVVSTVPYYTNSKVREGSAGWSTRYDNAYIAMTGTSMASPHIAGIAALMLGYSRDEGANGGKGWTSAEIKARMMNNATKMGETSEIYFSLNTVNLNLRPGETFDISASFNTYAKSIGYNSADVTWSISGDTEQITLNQLTGQTVTLSALDVGEADVTATFSGEGLNTISASCHVSVSLSVSGFTLDKDEINILYGSSIAQNAELLTLRPIVSPAEYAVDTQWSSSNGPAATGNVAKIFTQPDGSAKLNGQNSWPQYKEAPVPTEFITYADTFDVLGLGGHGRSTITAEITKSGVTHTAKAVINVYSTTAKVIIDDYEKHDFKAIGETLQLSSRPLGAAIFYGYELQGWSSDNHFAASVDENGLVVANGLGTAVITATYTCAGKPDLTASCTVTVPNQDIPALVYNKYSATVRHAASPALQGSDSSITILPNQAALDAGYVYKNYTFTGASLGYPVLVGNYDEVTGVVTAGIATNYGGQVVAQTLTVVYEAEEMPDITATVQIKYSGEFIKLDKTNLDLNVGNATYLTPTLSAKAMFHYDPTVTWTSSDESKVIVDEMGRIVAIADTNGSPVEITAKVYDDNNTVLSATCLVNVVGETIDAAAGLALLETVVVEESIVEPVMTYEEWLSTYSGYEDTMTGYASFEEVYGIQNDATGTVALNGPISLAIVSNAEAVNVPYSVYQVGAGMVNPVSAIDAKSYATSEVSVAYKNEEGVVRYDGKRESASFSFGITKVGQSVEKTLGATVYGDPGKTFDFSYAFSTGTRFGKNGLDVLELQASEAIIVGTNGRVDFNVSIKSVRETFDDDSGFYEGYVILTNTADSSEKYTMPFAINLRSSVQTVNEEGTFLNKPIISTGDDLQLGRWSPRATLYYQLNHSASSLYLGIIKDGGDYENENAWLGRISAGSITDPSLLQPGSLFGLHSVIYAFYYVVEEREDGYLYNVPYLIPEGKYQLVIATTGDIGTEYFPLDFIVDNTAPEFSIDGTEPDNNELRVYETDNTGSITLTGNVYDEAIDQMNAAGMTFDFYDGSENDTHAPKPDQTYNFIAAWIEGESYKFADIQPNGDFTINLTGLNPGVDTKVTFYVIDNFTVNHISSNYGTSTTGFDFTTPCFSEVYGDPFAFYGTNMKIQELMLRHNGPAITLNKVRRAISAGETFQFTGALNEAAVQAGMTQITWSSSNDSIATVSQDGVVTGVSAGTVKITATSDGANTITSVCSVSVLGISDANRIETGYNAFLDFGNLLHPNDLKNTDSGEAIYDKRDILVWNRATEWSIWGDEIDENGNGDGYLTIMEGFAINSLPFGVDAYDESSIRDYLNGEFYQKTFSEVEKSIIVPTDVKLGQYDQNEMLIPGSEKVLEDQHLYLPWGTSVTKDGVSKNTVFWSAGNAVVADNAIFRNAISEFERSYNKIGLSNRPIMGYVIYPSRSYYLRNQSESNKPTYVDKNGYVAEESNSSVYRGIVPVAKLDMSKVVFIASHLRTDDANFMGLSNQFYYLKTREGEHFKLTIQAGNEGKDIGTISGVPTNDITIRRGEDFTLSGLKANRAAGSANGTYQIAFKLTKDDGYGGREYVRYGVTSSTSTSFDISALNTRELDPGEYKLYVWLQKYNGTISTNSQGTTYDDMYIPNPPTSNEAGVVYNVNLTVEDVPETPKNLNDGVSIDKGDYVYYASIDHVSSTSSAKEGYSAPILWKMMGEEVSIGDINITGDGYLTLMSEYAVTNNTVNGNEYRLAPARSYLNNLGGGGFLSTDNFTAGEESAIPYFSVESTYWSGPGGSSMMSYEKQENQRVYMPWLWLYYYIIGYDELRNPVFNTLDTRMYWSANNQKLEQNQSSPVVSHMAGNEDQLQQQAVTYRNGTSTSYWLRTTADGAAEFVKAGGGYDYNGSGGSISRGIRPITKLIPDAILYASKITANGEVGITQPDEKYYRTPKDDVNYYKLTVLGGNAGKDIGTLTGVPGGTGKRTVTQNNGYVIDEVMSSQYGEDYVIAYKVVGSVNGERTIVQYGEFDTMNSAQQLTIETSSLKAGDYDVYVWLQKNNAINSNEAGVVNKFTLAVRPENSITGIDLTNGTVTITLEKPDSTLNGADFNITLTNNDIPVATKFVSVDQTKVVFSFEPVEKTALLQLLKVTVEFNGSTESDELAIAVYAVNFNVDGKITTTAVDHGDKVAQPADPVKTGYTFDGWRAGSITGEIYNFDTPITVGFTLYAVWKQDTVDTSIKINGVEIGNGQSSINFAIKSANGKGYTVYLSETNKSDSFKPYSNVNYNSKGAHVKGLTNGKKYYAYIEYKDDNGVVQMSDVVEFTPNK